MADETLVHHRNHRISTLSSKTPTPFIHHPTFTFRLNNRLPFTRVSMGCSGSKQAVNPAPQSVTPKEVAGTAAQPGNRQRSTSSDSRGEVIRRIPSRKLFSDNNSAPAASTSASASASVSASSTAPPVQAQAQAQAQAAPQAQQAPVSTSVGRKQKRGSVTKAHGMSFTEVGHRPPSRAVCHLTLVLTNCCFFSTCRSSSQQTRSSPCTPRSSWRRSTVQTGRPP